MAKTKIEYHGDEFFKKVKAEQTKLMTKAAITLKNQIKEDLSVPVKKEKGEPGRDGSGKFTKGKESVERSAPGEPPRKEHGELRRSMAHEIDTSKDQIVGRVGTNKIYGLWLEIGTSVMEKRPFLRPAVAKLRNVLARNLGGK